MKKLYALYNTKTKEYWEDQFVVAHTDIEWVRDIQSFANTNSNDWVLVELTPLILS